MAVLSTGPIENRPVGGVRPTQQVTVKLVNRDSANSSTVLIRGFYLNGTRTLYVLETVILTPNEVATRNYFANFDGFQFVFTTSGPAAESTDISAWGKNPSGQLVTAHRLVSDELLGSEVAGPQGPQGEQGPQGTQGPAEPESAFRAENDTEQDYTTVLVFAKVLFQTQVFDLNDLEYNPDTSLFIPQQSGVYSICTDVGFQPNFPELETNLSLAIRVNGDFVALESKFFPADYSLNRRINVCTIIQLQAGNAVDVLFAADRQGFIEEFARFDAARFPSP